MDPWLLAVVVAATLYPESVAECTRMTPWLPIAVSLRCTLATPSRRGNIARAEAATMYVNAAANPVPIKTTARARATTTTTMAAAVRYCWNWQ